MQDHPDSDQAKTARRQLAELQAKEKLLYKQFIAYPKKVTLLAYFNQFPNSNHANEVVRIGHDKNLGLWLKKENAMVVIEKLTSNDKRKVNNTVKLFEVSEVVAAGPGKTFATCILTLQFIRSFYYTA